MEKLQNLTIGLLSAKYTTMRIRGIERFTGTVSSIFDEAIHRLDEKGITQREVMPVFSAMVDEFTTPKSAVARSGDIAWTFAVRGTGILLVDLPLTFKYVGGEAIKVVIDRVQGKYMPVREHLVN